MFAKPNFLKDSIFFLDLTPEDLYIENEDGMIAKEKVEEILNILTPRQKEIIYYRFMEEMDYGQICELMNLSQQAAYNLLQRSLIRIREAYGIDMLLLLIMFLLCKNNQVI